MPAVCTSVLSSGPSWRLVITTLLQYEIKFPQPRNTRWGKVVLSKIFQYCPWGMPFTWPFSSHFLPKHPYRKITNSALLLDHYNLQSLPRLGVDRGKKLFRADVLVLCNLSLRYQREALNHVGPETILLRISFLDNHLPSSAHLIPTPFLRRKVSGKLLARENPHMESSPDQGVVLPSATGIEWEVLMWPAEWPQRCHTSAVLLPLSKELLSFHLYSFINTFH